MTRAQLDPAAARKFMLAGNATVTLESARTGARFTFNVRQGRNRAYHNVKVLTGSDNESDFGRLGFIKDGGAYRASTPENRDVSPDAPSARAFAWAWERINAGRMPDGLNVWHEGKCGRCNRKLTVPASIASGFGPECAGK